MKIVNPITWRSLLRVNIGTPVTSGIFFNILSTYVFIILINILSNLVSSFFISRKQTQTHSDTVSPWTTKHWSFWTSIFSVVKGSRKKRTLRMKFLGLHSTSLGIRDFNGRISVVNLSDVTCLHLSGSTRTGVDYLRRVTVSGLYTHLLGSLLISGSMKFGLLQSVSLRLRSSGTSRIGSY